MAHKHPLEYERIEIPFPIQKRRDLTASSRAIYGYIINCHAFNTDRYISVNNKEVSKKLNLSAKTIKEAFNILENYGLLVSKRVGRERAYRLTRIDPDGYPEAIPDYTRPKKTRPIFVSAPTET